MNRLQRAHDAPAHVSFFALHIDGKQRGFIRGDEGMGLMITAWRLRDGLGRPAQCLISERDGRWQLVVRHGAKLMLSEHCDTDDAALVRSTEIWRVLREQGWTEPRH